MTEEEAEKIREETNDMVRQMHHAFFEVPIGSSERPLIEDLREVVKTYKRLNWLSKAALYIAAGIGALGAAYATLKDWVTRASSGT